MEFSYIPMGEYDRVIKPSECLTVYEGSRFVRFFKDKYAAMKYGTKSNPKLKGNLISYMDNFGCLITEEVNSRKVGKNEVIDTIVRKISVPTKWEVIASVEVTVKKKNAKGELLEHTRMYYPSEEDYNQKGKEPKLKEIIFFEDNKSFLRKTVERFLTEDEIRKRIELGTITINPLAPDKVKEEMYGTKTIYTIDKQKKSTALPSHLKAFGSYTQTNEKEITYIKDEAIKPETIDAKDYLGPTEIEKDVVLYKNDEPKARIEQNDEITFKSTKTHKIKSKIVNYPDKTGNYGGEGRGTYASYDNKILFATGSQALNIRKFKDGRLGFEVGKLSNNPDAIVEVKGNDININISSQNVKKPQEFAGSILKTFKTELNVKPESKAKLYELNSEKPIDISIENTQNNSKNK